MHRYINYGTRINPTKESILEDIGARKANQRDLIVNSREIHLEEYDEGTNAFIVREDGRYKVTDFNERAIAQLSNRIGIPVGFFHTMPADLQEHVVNYQADRTDRNLLLRFATDINGLEFVRAVLSNRYGIADDSQIFPLVIQALEESGVEFEIRSFMYDAEITQMVVRFTDTKVRHGSLPISAGLMITNSEIGESSLWIEPVVLTGVIPIVRRTALRAQGVDMRILHRGEIKQQRIREAVLQMKDIAQVGIVQMMEDMHNMVTKEHALRFAKGIDALPKRIYDILEDSMEDVKEISRARVAMLIMASARKLPLFQRARVQQAASQITGVFNNYRARMADIIAEMETE